MLLEIRGLPARSVDEALAALLPMLRAGELARRVRLLPTAGAVEGLISVVKRGSLEEFVPSRLFVPPVALRSVSVQFSTRL